MSRSGKWGSVLVAGVGSVALLTGVSAMGQPGEKSAVKHSARETGGPPADDAMQACIEAGIPGEPHARLARLVGRWHGKSQMWMGPASAPTQGECSWDITSLWEGRYIRCDMTGELPGLGAFHGVGYTGFDNVSRKYIGTWLDSHSTGIMTGLGEISADGRAMHWTYTYNCPVRKAPATVRQVETYPDDRTMRFEMFTTDPLSGDEYRCMVIDLSRQP